MTAESDVRKLFGQCVFSPMAVFRWVLCWVALFMLFGYLYRWTSLSFSHDSLYVNELSGMEIVYSTIDNGRFLSPLYYLLRGGITAPFLIGALGSLYLVAAITLIVRLFGIENKLLITGLCGVLSVNACNILLNATYIKDFDCYMLSLLLSTVCVVLCVRKGWTNKLISVFSLVASLALYQAFVQVTLVLMLLYLSKMLLDGSPLRSVSAMVGQMLVVLAAAALGYMACYEVVQLAFHYHPASSYNSIDNVGAAFFGGDFLALLAQAYVAPFAYLAAPETYAMLLAGVLNSVVFVSILICAFYAARCKGMSVGSMALFALLLALMPLAASCVSVLGNGFRHGLTIYSFNMLYLVAAMLVTEMASLSSSQGLCGERVAGFKGLLQGFLAIACLVIVGSNIIYANQVSLKKDLEFESTYSAMTRIVDTIDGTEGYIVGETPVAIIGRLDQNAYLTGVRSGFPPEGLPDNPMYGTGLQSEVAVTGRFSYGYYFRNIMAYPINLVESQLYEDDPAYAQSIDDMPIFPQKGYCELIDGIVFVRLSEEY